MLGAKDVVKVFWPSDGCPSTLIQSIVRVMTHSLDVQADSGGSRSEEGEAAPVSVIRTVDMMRYTA